MSVVLNSKEKLLTVVQELSYYNQSTDTIQTLVLNDWNNAYTNVNTPLAKRFSDEFYRGFHLAKEEERGSTKILSITNSIELPLQWDRNESSPDLVFITLKEKIAPNQKGTIKLSYIVKIPSNRFTKFGYDAAGSIYLKEWFLAPALYHNHEFMQYSNENLDDSANALTDFDIELQLNTNHVLTSDLDQTIDNQNQLHTTYYLTGKSRTNFTLFIAPKNTFSSFKNDALEVLTDFQDNKVSMEQQTAVISRIVNYVNNNIGRYPHKKIIVSQTDYERNPFYGLNQLPSFISPFSNEFTFEIKFLKTYLHAYLKASLTIDNRKDSWIYDGIQVHTMMKYMEDNHPNSKMLGRAAGFKLLKSYHLTNLDFNEQYSYFYTLMARRNLDQSLANAKNSLVKFNEQIASKYRAGLSLRYLDSYLGDTIVANSIREFYTQNTHKQLDASDFENSLKAGTTKDIDWFFETVINSRALIDYKFKSVTKSKDSVSFRLKNKTETVVPIPVYGMKKGEIVFKKWLEPQSTDSIFTMERKAADKLVLNYKNEVPEYNLRNNWRSLKPFFPNNRPIKFVFLKDLEDPYYNQVLYVPTLTYNLYDGLSPGLRLHNKTVLEKPFVFDINPAYSTTAKTLSGSAIAVINQNYRNSKLYNVRYSLSSSYFHYAPDATYLRINPTVQLRFREDDYRDNKKQLVLLRQVLVNREKSAIIIDNSKENYSVFNAKYFNTKTEATDHLSFMTDVQLSGKFGKVATELEFRRLFENNHQLSLRFYAGSFLYNKTNSDYFSFALDRPTDYLFDYNYYGRSESKGFFSQQLIVSEGGFKSKLAVPFANQWISTATVSYSVFNWFEAYGDIGFVKNKFQSERFLYDTGFRLNLVPDYFEVYFPVYSSNGWEIAQKNYNEKIRFVITLSPKILINLFNRKWF
jgi:hypothetical protein